MALGEWLDRVGGNIGDNISNAPPDAWFGLAQALAGSQNLGQGLAQGIAGFGQATQAAKKKAGLAEALKGMSGELDPRQKMLIENYPELALPQLAENAFKAPKAAEKPSGVQEYEYAKEQGFPGTFLDFQLAQKKAGASNTTINNIPAEVGARVALGEGFLGDFDRIKATAEKFYGAPAGEQIKRRGQMIFNTGEGGKLWRDVETGKESLIRNLTGQGMAMAEATQQASRYSISPYDTQYDALTKLDGLKRDLENVARGAYGAKGGKYTPPASGGNYKDVDKILGLE